MLNEVGRVIVHMASKGYSIQKIVKLGISDERTVRELVAISKHCIWCCHVIDCAQCESFRAAHRHSGTMGGMSLRRLSRKTAQPPSKASGPKSERQTVTVANACTACGSKKRFRYPSGAIKCASRACIEDRKKYMRDFLKKRARVA